MVVQAQAPPTRLVPTTLREFEADLLLEHRDDVAEGVVALTLTSQDGQELPSWTPGAHIDLVLQSSGLTRQYSLCGSPADRRKWRIAVLHTPASRGGSRFIHRELKPGTAIRVRGPRNHFPLVDAPRYAFIAGGIGVTPLLPMTEAAQAAGADWQMFYGGRSRGSMAFLDQLSGYGERVHVWPQDEAGLLPLDSILAEPRDDTLVYCCGPEPLLQAVEQLCRSWPPGSLHVERFVAKEIEPESGGDDEFEIMLERSGVTLTVPVGKSILDVVEDARVGNVLASCRTGLCGTCETGVLEGTPDHRDSVLTDAERQQGEAMMICISRSRTPRLVLDL
jgi:ferredoxin-NADP reductase